MSERRRNIEIVGEDDVRIETYVDGDGPPFVILPSYGRDSVDDFDPLTSSLAEAGWLVLRPQPRGIRGSRGAMNGLSLEDLADDVALVIRRLARGPALLLGHTLSAIWWRGSSRPITPSSCGRWCLQQPRQSASSRMSIKLPS
jgi:pimeloyl-ACP methyl ester carboxylesterase